MNARFILLHTLLCFIPCSVGSAQSTAPDFNRDILPILSNNCFACHGPDPAARKASLRLDMHDTAIDARNGAGAAIVPGDPDASLLVQRIRAAGDDRMPPPDSHRSLTPEEIERIERWIADGAPWNAHWSFIAPEPTELPDDHDWCRTAVDRFVLDRMHAHGLSPAHDADRRTLLRRVTLDLVGLPPTDEERAAFLSDELPGAYERAVDRLLADPRYGEHMARPWLDLARYADSQGFEKDNPRVMWRYRDWVIDAFNADMPFDEFTRQQIAGDLLDSPSLDQLIATGFHRNTQTNTEGGTDNEEFRSAAVIDRVNTTMQAWMGLTMACAQCHAHKYDPIDHEEYFGLYAFFNQTEDADLDDDRPFIKAPTTEQTERLDALESIVSDIERRLDPPDEEVRRAIHDWLEARDDAPVWDLTPPASTTTTSSQTIRIGVDGVLTASGERPATDAYTIVLDPATRRVSAIRLEVMPDPTRPGPGRAGNGNFVVNDIEVRTSASAAPRIELARAEATFNQTDYHVDEAIDDDAGPYSGWAVMGGTATDQQAVFIFAEPLELEDDEQLVITLHQTHGTSHVLERFRLGTTDHADPSLPMPEAIRAIVDVTPSERSASQRAALARHVLPRSPALAPLHARLEDAAARRDAHRNGIQNALVMRELPSERRRTTHLFNGGSFLAPATDRGEIRPGVPAILHAWPETAPANRLGLADWLVAPANPLTARVQVNRIWAMLFGTGLVSTIDDFGIQGERPTHPELLDWLALRFANELQWSRKRLLRLLVTSSVYRQAAIASADAAAIDPDNRYLSHAPRLRLTAEQLRDQALAASGILDTTRIGGPSVMPHLPDGMLPQAFTTLVLPASSGDDLYRRGLYTTWRRTGHYPSFATFDAPSREVCTVTRERSNTPLQALVLLNDPVFVEAAQALARLSMVQGGPVFADRIDTACERTLGRLPDDRERAVLRALYDDAFARAQEDPDAAGLLATDPRGPLPEGMTVEDASAMTVVCNVLLNLDEVINRP